MTGNTWKWIHFCLIFVLLMLWLAAGIFGWVESVIFVSHVSMLALVLAEISSWQGARTEAKQDQQIEENNERDNIQDQKLFE